MAVAIFPVLLTDGTAQGLWEALQRDERWSRPATVSLSVDLDQPGRALVGARFDDITAANAFRDEIGHLILPGELMSGFNVELAGPPTVYVPEGLQPAAALAVVRALQRAPRTSNFGGWMEVLA